MPTKLQLQAENQSLLRENNALKDEIGRHKIVARAWDAVCVVAGCDGGIEWEVSVGDHRTIGVCEDHYEDLRCLFRSMGAEVVEE